MIASLTRVAAIALKEFRHLGRDPRSLLAVVITPVLQLLLFAYAISFDVDHVATIVVDFDQTPASRAYLAKYESSTLFEVVARGERLRDVDEAFATGRAQVAVVVQPGFGRALDVGERGQVAVLIDGSEPNQSRISQAYSVALNQLYDQQITRDWADAQGIDLSGLGQLEPRIRTWYNPERRSSDFLIPGLMAVILAIVTVQQTAVTLVRERILGTQEQLETSPLRRPELMVGKLLPWTLIAFADVVMITVLGWLVFDLPMRGSWATLALGAVLFVFASLGIGLAISAVAPSMETANISALLAAFLPGFLLSGFAFPLDQIPFWLEWISRAFPARYMVTIGRGVFLKGAGFAELWPELLSLTVFAMVMLVASSLLHARRRRG